MPPHVDEVVQDNKQDSVVVASYVCHDLEKPVVSDLTLLSQVPVIDMEKLLLANTGDDHDTELEKLHLACKDWGFFQMINHQVSYSLLDKMRSEVQGFFYLPVEEKIKFERKEGNFEGYADISIGSNEQNLESLVGMFYLTTLPTHLRKPHLFPQLPVSFRDTLEEYATQLEELALKIFNVMAKALGMKAEDLNALFEGGEQSMRLNHYPLCPQQGAVMGLNPHTDGPALTILLQVNEVEGLHIKKDGAWIPITPLPNAFVVNVGDMIEIVTNGIYKSVEHRPVFNPNKERLSIATFYKPRMEANLGPAPSLITPQNPAKFKHIGTVADYSEGYFGRRPEGKSYLDTVRIESTDKENI